MHVNHQQLNTSLMLKCTFQDEKEGTANWKRFGQDNFWVTIMDILHYFVCIFDFSIQNIQVFV